VLHKDVLSQADTLVSMKLTSSQDRAAVGRWIEGQADRSEGQRILAALPRLGRGEGWVWAPSDGILARVAFPLIRTFDSSGAPRKPERGQACGPRPPVNLASLAAALGEAETDDAEGGDDHDRQVSDRRVRALERRLRQREQELAVALTRIAALEATMPVKAIGKAR
jgi:hypothetical protein